MPSPEFEKMELERMRLPLPAKMSPTPLPPLPLGFPFLSGPMRLPSIVLPDELSNNNTPSKMLPEMRLRAAGEAPPMVESPVPRKITPDMLARLLVPSAWVPKKLPSTLYPVPPDKLMPKSQGLLVQKP